MIEVHCGPGITAAVLLIVAVHLFPLWLIARKMGYPGIIAVLALIPVIQLILAYFLAWSEWPAHRRAEGQT